jgi:tRNA A-37 threonylcarbamoyl transferase component Bud32
LKPSTTGTPQPDRSADAAATTLDVQATGAFPHQPTSPSEAAPQVPGYEVLGTLGRGGMGVVYRARHLALKRLVALKMIRHTGQADEAERARFKAEGEAVARLSHPNIVQVFEVGEVQGQPFCALELVEGGSLAQKLKGRPLPAREAARLVEALAQAMHLAHSRNVVHRDLKPTNVLLTEEGTPKVTDFGLARQLDTDSGQTQTGIIMGTPSYMAPEQASGQAHAAGPAADVYALGAILYEALTGCPPFKGATLLETLEQVRSSEPVPPTRLVPRLPRDLETICLKCLQKEPERRYSSARELADDLGRFQRGEPVTARPVGVVERLGKWVRRRPAVAGLLAAMLLLAVVGGGLTAWFAVEARIARADRAADARTQEAELQKRDALARAEVAETREHTATIGFARMVARPLGYQSGLLGPAERDALWELAATDNDQARLIFFEEGLASPEKAIRLQRRGPWAVQAAVGLDPGRRAQVRDLLLGRLREGQAGPAVWEACVSLGRSLELKDEEFARLACRALLDNFAQSSNPEALAEREEAFEDFAANLPEQEQRGLYLTAAQRLFGALVKTTDLKTRKAFQDALGEVAEKLGPEEAARVVSAVLDLLPAERAASKEAVDIEDALRDTLAQLVGRLEAEQRASLFHAVAVKATTPLTRIHATNRLVKMAEWLGPEEASLAAAWSLESLAKVRQAQGLADYGARLTKLAERMRPEQVARAGTDLLDILVRTSDPFALVRLVEILEKLAQRMTPEKAAELSARGAQHLLKLLATPPNMKPDPGVQHLAETLARLAARLGPQKEAELCSQGVRILLARPVSFPFDPAFSREDLALGLTALSKGHSPEEAARTGSMVLEVMAGPYIDKTPIRLKPLADGLVRLTERTGQEQATELCTRGARRLLDILKVMPNTPDYPPGARFLIEGVTNLLGRLSPEQAAGLLNGIPKSDHGLAQKTVVEALVKASERKGPEEAAKVVAAFLDVQVRTREPFAQQALEEGLKKVAGRLTPEEAFRNVSVLLDALAGAPDQSVPITLERSLVLVLERLGPRQAADSASVLLDKALALTRFRGATGLLLWRLGKITEQCSPEEMSRVTVALVDALAKTDNPESCYSLAQGLVSMAGRLAPDEAAKATAAVLDALPKIYALALPIAEWPGKLGERLGPEKAAELFARGLPPLLDALAKTDKPNVRNELALGLVHLAGWLVPDDAAKAATAVLDVLPGADNSVGSLIRGGLQDGLGKLAGRLRPEQARKTALAVPGAMARINDPSSLRCLAEFLAKLAERLPQQQATEPCEQGAKILFDRMILILAKPDKPATFVTLASLPEGLAKLAERLPPEKATELYTRAADSFLEKLNLYANSGWPNLTKPLTEGLVHLAERLPHEKAAELCARASQLLIAILPQKNTLYGVDGNVAEALAKLTKHLGPEQAAELRSQLAQRLLNFNAGINPVGGWGGDWPKLAELLGPERAAELRSHFAQRILDTLSSRLVHSTHFYILADLLATTAESMGREQAAEVCARGAKPLLDALRQNLDIRNSSVLVMGLVKLADHLSPEEVSRVASAVLDAMTRSTPKDPDWKNLWQAVTVLAERCPDQALLQLLKHPFAVDTAFDTLRDVLNKRLGQNFETRWEMVAWLRQHRPDLDLTAPPWRAER